MPLSVIHKGEVLDFHYKRQMTHYAFYIGDILLGQIFRSRTKGWTPVPFEKRYDIGPVRNFKTRLDAAEFLIDYMGYGMWNKDDLG